MSILTKQLIPVRRCPVLSLNKLTCTSQFQSNAAVKTGQRALLQPIASTTTKCWPDTRTELLLITECISRIFTTSKTCSVYVCVQKANVTLNQNMEHNIPLTFQLKVRDRLYTSFQSSDPLMSEGDSNWTIQ